MNIQGKIKNLLFFVVLATYSILSGLEIGQLKDVYSYIDQKYWHVIPTNLTLENKFLENMYNYGPENLHTTKLVNLLFHQVPGNFKISDGNPSVLAYYLRAETIGGVIGIIEKYTPQKDKNADTIRDDLVENIEKLLNATKKKYDKEYIKSIEKELVACQKKLNDIQNLRDMIETALDIRDLATTAVVGEKGEEYIKKIQNLRYKLSSAINVKFNAVKDSNILELKAKEMEHLKNLARYSRYLTMDTKLQNDDQKIKYFAEAITGSLKECGYFDKKDAIFPADVTEKILLVFAFEKMKEKAELRGYFDAVSKLLQQSIVADGGKFDPSTRYTDPEYKSIFAKVQKESQATTLDDFLKAAGSFEQFLCAVTTKNFYDNILPKIITTQSGVSYEGNGFSDCMETTLRNLFNILYFTKNTVVSIENWGKELQDFYIKYPSQNNLSDPKQHDDWALVVENLPFIAYKKIYNVKKKTLTVTETDGFIYGFDLPQKAEEFTGDLWGDNKSFHKIAIDGKTFIHVDKTAINNKYKLFEVKASMKNAIIMLNHHQQLKLFTDINKSFFEEDFCKTFFPQLCEKVGWTFDTPKTKDNIDSEVYYVESGGALFSIHTPSGHGYVNKESTSEKDPIFGTISTIVLAEAEKAGTAVAKNSDLLSFCKFDITKTNIDNKIINYLFMQQLDNKDNARGIIKYVFYKGDVKGNFGSFIEESLCCFVEKIQSENLPALVDAIGEKNKNSKLAKKIYEVAFAAGLKSGLSLASDLFRKLFKIDVVKEKAFEAAIKVAGTNIDNGDGLVRTVALGLFGDLFKIDEARKKAFEVAIKVAGTNINNENGEVRMTALGLFENLFKIDVLKEKAFAAAITVAEMNIQHSDADVRISVLKLFAQLVAKGQAFDVATKAAENSMQNEKNVYEKAAALNLFGSLVEKQHGGAFKGAAQAVSNCVTAIKENLNITPSVRKLVETMERAVEQMNDAGVASQEIFSAAAQVAGAVIWDSWVTGAALDLFRRLFGIDAALEEAIRVATTVVEENKDKDNADSDIKKSLEALQKMIDEAQKKEAEKKGFIEAAKAAGAGMENANDDVRASALEQFEKLFTIAAAENEAFIEAVKAAGAGMENANDDVKISALRLFAVLVEKGKAYTAATKAAGAGMENANDDVKISALRLFAVLVEKGKAYTAATKAAGAGMKNADNFVKKLALELFVVLVEKGKAYTAATKAAGAGMKNADNSVKKLALKLFAKLVEKGKAYTAATKAVGAGMENTVNSVKISALELFVTLVEKGHEAAYTVATKAACDGIINADVRYSALKLFAKLVEKGHAAAYIEAAKAAGIGINDESISVKFSALELFVKLVEKEHAAAYIEAAKAAGIGINIKNSSVRKSALKLFETLFKNDAAREQAIKAANDVIEGNKNNSDPDIQKDLESLKKKIQ